MRDIQIDERVKLMTMPMDLVSEEAFERRKDECRTASCGELYDLSTGVPPFPVPDVLVNALKENAHRGKYSSPQGIQELREAIAGYNKRHFDLDVDPSRIVIGNGTMGIMYLLFSIIDGHVLLPAPSWPGYLPMVTVLGKSYHILPTRREEDYKLSPEHLDRMGSQLEGGQHLLVLNNPHNPTGTLYSRKELEALATVCRERNILVLADEIYALLTYGGEGFTSMGTIYPEGTFVTNGMSKDRSAAGWRFGHCIMPETSSSQMSGAFAELASAMYSNVSTPTQYAAVTAYSPSKEIDEYMAVNREIYRMVGTYMATRLGDIEGVDVMPPKGAYYVLGDFNPSAERLSAFEVKTSRDLMNFLIEPGINVATLSGDTCLLDAGDLKLRISFVDFDGGAAIRSYLERRPSTRGEERAFVEDRAPHISKGLDSVQSFLEGLRKAEAPRPMARVMPF